MRHRSSSLAHPQRRCAEQMNAPTPRCGYAPRRLPRRSGGTRGPLFSRVRGETVWKSELGRSMTYAPEHGKVHLRGHDPFDGEAPGPCLRISKQFRKVNSTKFAITEFYEVRELGFLGNSVRREGGVLARRSSAPFRRSKLIATPRSIATWLTPQESCLERSLI